MNNFEKYEEELKDKDVNDLWDFFYEKLSSDKAVVVSADLKDVIDYLYQKCDPFTDDEKVILNALHKHYKWIARGLDDILYVYEYKPKRVEKKWYIRRGAVQWMGMYNHIFKNITWENGAVCFRGDECE